MQALLFSPHSDEAAVLTVILQQAGFTVRSVRELERAIEAWPQQPAEFIMICLKGEHDTTLNDIQQMRSHTVVPIVVIVDRFNDDFWVDVVHFFINNPMLSPQEIGVKCINILNPFWRIL